MSNIKGRISKLEQESMTESENAPGSRIVFFYTFPDGQIYAPSQGRLYPDEDAFWQGIGKDPSQSVPLPWHENISPEEFLAELAARQAATAKELENWQPSEYARSLIREGASATVAMLLEKLTNHNSQEGLK